MPSRIAGSAPRGNPQQMMLSQGAINNLRSLGGSAMRCQCKSGTRWISLFLATFVARDLEHRSRPGARHWGGEGATETNGIFPFRRKRKKLDWRRSLAGQVTRSRPIPPPPPPHELPRLRSTHNSRFTTPFPKPSHQTRKLLPTPSIHGTSARLIRTILTNNSY